MWLNTPYLNAEKIIFLRGLVYDLLMVEIKLNSLRKYSFISDHREIFVFFFSKREANLLSLLQAKASKKALVLNDSIYATVK